MTTDVGGPYTLEQLEQLERTEHEKNRFVVDGLYVDARWGGWELDLRYGLVLLEPSKRKIVLYEADLESCTSSAEVLDWIIQIDGKQFIGHEMINVVAGLVRAYNDVLEPQANLCSFGQDLRLSVEQVKNLINEFIAAWPYG